MAHLSFRATRWRRALVVTAVGELTAENASDLGDALERPDSVRRLVLDLRSLTLIDAAGLDAIAQAHTDIRRDGRQLIVVRPRLHATGWRTPVSEAGSPPIAENIVEAIAEPEATGPGNSSAASQEPG